MLRLSNDAKITELSINGHNVIGQNPGHFWKLLFKRGENWENLVDPSAQTYTFTQEGNRQICTVEQVRYGEESLALTLRFVFEETGDRISCHAEIENHEDLEVIELAFPILSGFTGLEPNRPDDLLWPYSAGKRYADLGTRNETLEMLYPFPASMQWMGVTNGRRSLYFGSHDVTFGITALRADLKPGSASFDFVKYPFVAKDECWRSAPFVLSLYQGDWHVGADCYKAWMSTWRAVIQRPDWVKKMKGMLLVILKQQYGDVMWKYSDLPALLEYAKRNGMDTLGMFGWTEGGHDNKYPVFEPNPVMGGRSELEKYLKVVEDQGGNTILYCQGLLLDVSHDYYRKGIGQEIAVKSMWGTPYHQQYNKFYHSNMLSHFNEKEFALACPGHPEWIAEMSRQAEKYMDYGTNGILYDQIGGIANYLCFDENHHHDKPNTAMPQGRLQWLRAIRQTIKTRKPNFAFTTELLTDVFSQYIDVLHGWSCCTPTDEDVFPSMFRYTVRDTLVTVRNPRPFISVPMSNFALTYGFRLECEIRYLQDKLEVLDDRYAAETAYAKQISQLRDRYWDLLGEGEFRDTEGITCGNPALAFTCFTSGEAAAYVVWNPTDSAQPVSLTFAGEVQEIANPTEILDSIPAQLEPQGIFVLIVKE